jgi:hypothetical protein
MRIQSHRQRVNKLRGPHSIQKHIPWRRLIALALALVLIVGGASIWIAQSTNQGFWSNALSIIFVAGGIVIGLLQWLFPISSHNPEPSDSQPLPLSRQPLSSPVAARSRATMSSKEPSGNNTCKVRESVVDSRHEKRRRDQAAIRATGGRTE